MLESIVNPFPLAIAFGAVAVCCGTTVFSHHTEITKFTEIAKLHSLLVCHHVHMPMNSERAAAGLKKGQYFPASDNW